MNDNDKEVLDVSPAESSAASVTDSQPEGVTAPPAEGAKSDPPSETANPEKTFSDTVKKLESGSSPKEAVQKSEAKPEEKQDEPSNGVAKDKSVLSQQAEESLNKDFAKRPEWDTVIQSVRPEQKAKVRAVMRTIFQKENELTAELSAAKPVLQTFERFRKGVGDDQAVENTIKLVEMFSKGDPKAREMLVTLLNDLDARTGAVLTSQDLMQRNRSIDDRLQQGTIDDNEAKQLRNDLLEMEKLRVTAKRSEAEVQQRDKREQQTTVEAQMQATEDAGTEWEKSKMGSDPDYPALKDTVEKVAKAMLLDHSSFKSGKVLTPTEAVKILNDSLAWAKSQVSIWQPKPRPRNGLNGHGSSSSATSRRQPANAAEEFSQRIDELEARRGR